MENIVKMIDSYLNLVRVIFVLAKILNLVDMHLKLIGVNFDFCFNVFHCILFQ